ncbi:MAG: DUF309 domain-containing protein [Planctomycetota bacterium]
MHGASASPPPPLAEGDWRDHADYLQGVDLFNHGFFWEAHEAWEGVWHANARRGDEASLLAALIRLAALRLKIRDERPEGRASLARGVEAALGPILARPTLCGLVPATLLGLARAAGEEAPILVLAEPGR